MLGRPVNDVDAAVFAPGRFTTTYADEAAVARAMPPRR
jgi:hypothetical protein